MDYITLNNGVRMPQLGYGVYQVSAEECEHCVADALSVGYRAIDTAQAYGNEEGVGAAVANSGIPRDQIFLTTKIWISNAGEKRAAASIDESLARLGTDYVDLLLIHQPFGDYYGTYRAMEAALKAGKARAIGVSNFMPDHLVDLCAFVDVTPAVNQVETHVFQQQRAARTWMDRLGVAHESWGPFAEGRKGLFDNPVLVAVGAKHGKSSAQVALRFLLQEGVIVIPKSSHKERMAQNLDVFDFALDDDDLGAIRALDEGESAFFDHHVPAIVEKLTAIVEKLTGLVR